MTLLLIRLSVYCCPRIDSGKFRYNRLVEACILGRGYFDCLHHCGCREAKLNDVLFPVASNANEGRLFGTQIFHERLSTDRPAVMYTSI